MKNVFLVLALAVVASSATVVGVCAQSVEDGIWRGYMAVPNGEEFGFSLDVETSGERVSGILTPDPVPAERFRVGNLKISDRAVSFKWQPGSFVVECTMKREPGSTYFGVCIEPAGSMAPSVIAPPGEHVVQKQLDWERVRRMRDTAREREELDNIAGPRGKKIDIGGYGLYTFAAGEGEPAVVFVSGLADDMRTWDYVHHDVQKFTTAVSYSRSGLGFSDASPREKTPSMLAEELHSVLRSADVESPYVFVGHGLGSVFIQAFAEKYPGEIAGLVLLDPAHELEGRKFTEIDADSWKAYLEGQENLYNLAPDPIREEFEIYRDLVKRGAIEGAGSLPDVPTVVLTPMKAPEQERWIGETEAGLAAQQELHERMIEGLKWARHENVPESGTYIQREEPDAVVDAIRSVLDAIQNGRPDVN